MMVADCMILWFPGAGAGRDAVPVCSVDSAMSAAPENKHERAAVPATGKCCGLVVPCRELCTVERGTEIISCNLLGIPGLSPGVYPIRLKENQMNLVTTCTTRMLVQLRSVSDSRATGPNRQVTSPKSKLKLATFRRATLTVPAATLQDAEAGVERTTDEPRRRCGSGLPNTLRQDLSGIKARQP